MFSVKDKVVVITGGAGVLGSHAAESLAEAGAKVVILDRVKEYAHEFVDQLNKKFPNSALGLECDVLSKDSLLQAKDTILKVYRRIDALLNAAGGNMPGATIGIDQTIFDLSLDDFQKVTDLNLNGTVIPSLVFGQVMAEQGHGSIVNYSSMTVDRAITRVVGYSASKAAMENFTRWFSVEMATKFSSSIRVNAIAPGFFIGEQNRALLTNEDGSYTERGDTIIRNTPMKRFGEPGELNGVIHFLLSDASKFMTGVVVPVDGGFSAFSGV